MKREMPTIVDMHCHVLPGVDDGPATMEDSVAILREAARQGLSGMIVTPHYHPGRYMVEAERNLETLQAVREELKRQKIDLKLESGSHRSSRMWYCRLYSIMMCQHLNAWALPKSSSLKDLFQQAA